MVEVKNTKKSTGYTEWLLAQIEEIENGKYKVQVINSSLFGAKFIRCSNEIRKYSSTGDNFQINEIVEIKNRNEWILGKIIGKEKGQYIVRIQSGIKFRRYPNEVRKCADIANEMKHEISDFLEEASSSEPKSLNQNKTIYNKHGQNFVNNFQINEIVELRNYNEWILGKIIGKEDGKYIISVVSGHAYGKIFRRYSDDLRKYDLKEALKHYEIGEIVEIKSFDQQTKQTNWIKAKILEINQGNNCSVEVVDKCKLIGGIIKRNIYSMRKFKIESFQVGEQVEVCIYHKIEDKTEWVKSKILGERNGMYILGTGTNILEEYPCNIRKIKSG
ncbi:unnamed protein product [Meloidogyne enterolobii]|uniref:Uncharacterized protein n=1 Tax=Meloidogyne enterolobii TaxID=390850 RepID=A0ACB0ZXK3_MELEN